MRTSEEFQEHENRSIVFFDGVCNFCNGTVDWVWKKNKIQNLYFSSLQSDFAQNFLSSKGITDVDMSTIYYYHQKGFKKKSKAVFSIMRQFRGGYRVLGAGLSILPALITDFFYDLVARNRYKIAGRRDSCRVPTTQERARFIE